MIVFVIMIQRIFPSWALAPTHCAIFIGYCPFLYFQSWIKSAFLVSIGLLCLYDKQNNTWLVNSWWGALIHLSVLKPESFCLILLKAKCKSTGSLTSILFKTPVFLFPNFFFFCSKVIQTTVFYKDFQPREMP